DQSFLREHTTHAGSVLAALEKIPIGEFCARTGVSEAQGRAVAARIGVRARVAILEDLGIQQAPHSTLNSYLEKLLYLLTGNFGREGTMNGHTGRASLGGDFRRDSETPVTGARIITGLIPSNSIADEIL